jgi:hypothetical protein
LGIFGAQSKKQKILTFFKKLICLRQKTEKYGINTKTVYSENGSLVTKTFFMEKPELL